MNRPRYRKSKIVIELDVDFFVRYDATVVDHLSYITIQTERKTKEISLKHVRHTSEKINLWINETITKKTKELMRDCMRSMDRSTKREHVQDQDRQRRSQQFNRTEGWSERVDTKRVGEGKTIHQQVLHSSVRKQRHGGSFNHGMSDIF